MSANRGRSSCSPKPKTLFVEALEERRLLAASSPWQNPVYPLDTNADSNVSPVDALLVINRLINEGPGPLPDPGPTPPTFYVDTTGDNNLTPLDALRVINRLNTPTQVTLTTMVPFSIDVTPPVWVTATSPGALPNGTEVKIDVDLNNDGDFSDPGELNYSQGVMWDKAANFPLTKALPLNVGDQTYTVGIRARVRDADGLEGTSVTQKLIIDTRTSTALADYVKKPDDVYSYSVARTTVTPFYTHYVLDMTSQTWRSSAEVNKPNWRHWVEVIVPTTLTSTTGLLVISGGSNNFGNPPSSPDSTLAQIAAATGSVVTVLRTVPSEPLIFSDETRDRSEDEIIAYSFDKYLTNIGAEGNDSWPVLVAMAKSAVRAMDSVQSFLPTVQSGATLNDFVVTGYSKRGWTTWLTAAVDPRVKAIIPGVFDNLNQGPQMVHHYGVYGFFSDAVQDYNDMQIFQRIMTPEAQLLSQIVDPYRYIYTGAYDNMPKLILNSAGDEFFVSDSSQLYFDDLPGDKNYMRYIPNTGHGLDTRAAESTLTFYDAVINNRELPKFSWTLEPEGSIRVEAETLPTQVKLWQATNPTARDFRNSINPNPPTWTSRTLVPLGSNVYYGDVPMPASGATAYFIELTFPSQIVVPFVFTTDIRVKSELPWHPWPFVSGFPGWPAEAGGAPLAAEPSGASLDATAFALALASESTSEAPAPLASLSPAAVEEVALLMQSSTQSPQAEFEFGELFSDENGDDRPLTDVFWDPELADLLA